ncbi:MAG: DUF3568 family protein [Gemmataceae bacterium]
MKGALRRMGWLVLAAAMLLPTGCVALAVTGAAVGAGTAGYLYYNGLLYRDFRANLGDSVAAVRTSLAELQFPIVKEKNDTGHASFQSQTGNGYAVRIYLDTAPSPVPSEGAVTRISVRVGFSGDDVVSAKILDQVSKHLTSATSIPGSKPEAPIPAVALPGSGTAPPPSATGAAMPAVSPAPSANETIGISRTPGATVPPAASAAPTSPPPAVSVVPAPLAVRETTAPPLAPPVATATPPAGGAANKR